LRRHFFGSSIEVGLRSLTETPQKNPPQNQKKKKPSKNRLVTTAAKHLGVSVDGALEAYGAYFVRHVADQGYTRLMQVLGPNLAAFLQNLNNLHLHLSMGWPAMVAPGFRCEDVGPDGLTLHYYSSRPGLWPIVVGVLKGVAATYFGIDLAVELVAGRHEGAPRKQTHEVFALRFPEAQAALGPRAPLPSSASYAMPRDVFYELHPFHMLLDDQLVVLQHGAGLARVAPGIKPGDRAAQHFRLSHPHVRFDHAALVENADSHALLVSKATAAQLKGQMLPTTLPPCPAFPAPRRALLFLGSPRLSNLDEMRARGLFLSDFPLHDMARDFVLLAEQRQAEADLKEKYERLTVELRAANDKLARTTRWLEEEKARAEALLHRMSGLIACFPGAGDAAAAGGAGGAAGVPPGLRGPGAAALAAALNQVGAEGAGASASAAVVAALSSMAAGGGAGAGSVVSGVSGAGGGGSLISGSATTASTLERIEAVRRELSKANIELGTTDQIQCMELLGEGTYGKVWKGLWKGSVVAVKTMLLPANMSGAEKREKMAVMEAAISSALSHPNILQTFTYDIRAVVSSEAAGGGDEAGGNGGGNGTAAGATSTVGAGGGVTGSAILQPYEVRLVLEYCDRGSLREALDAGAFRLATPAPTPVRVSAAGPDGSGDGSAAAIGSGDAAAAAVNPTGAGGGSSSGTSSASLLGTTAAAAGASSTGGVNLAAVLDTAIDVAAAMVHLHRRNVLHGDLKARNIMLKSSGSEGRGVTTKLADFGLAVRIDHAETHMSGAFQGTMTHMAPEIMLKGHVSKAADVYAFGMLLWETVTAQHAYKGVPRALLGHQVTVLRKRPDLPAHTPPELADLIRRCWDASPSKRPRMEEVLAALQRMRVALPPATPPLALGGSAGSSGRLTSGASVEGAPSMAALERIRRARAAQATTGTADDAAAGQQTPPLHAEAGGGGGAAAGHGASGGPSAAAVCPFAAGRGSAAAAAAMGASGPHAANASVYLEHTFSTMGHHGHVPILHEEDEDEEEDEDGREGDGGAAAGGEVVLAYGYDEDDEGGGGIDGRRP
jgi:serine/threonine protein kinase